MIIVLLFAVLYLRQVNIRNQQRRLLNQQQLFRSQMNPHFIFNSLTNIQHYIFKKDKISYEDGMKLMKESGLDSLPGGGAEIFDEEVRKDIAGGKCSSEEWLRIHEIWHGLGMRSNATMLYGHVETNAHRVDHMNRLRDLQDKTGGFQTFIPLKFKNQNNEMSYLEEVSAVEDLRNYAIGRIFLDNFDHINLPDFYAIDSLLNTILAELKHPNLLTPLT